MNHKECPRKSYIVALLSAMLLAALALSGCGSAAASKAEHVRRGEAFLKEKKYQEASIEFRNATQIDDHLAAAHWGLARAYEGLERWSEMMDELVKPADLDGNNLDARVRLGNYYLAANVSRKSPDLVAEADRLAKEVLQKDPNHIEGHILMATVLFSQGRPEKSHAELERAIQIDTSRIESLLNLARYYV